MREFAVVLPILTCYSLSLSWLLNWFPRPTVKLKFVARCDDELDEGFADRSKGFVGCWEFSICDDRGQLGIQWENGFTVVERQPDQRSSDLRHLPGLFDGVFFRSDFGGNVFGDGSYPLGFVVPGVSRGLKWSLVGNFLMQKLLEVFNGEHEIHVLLRVIKEPGKLVRNSLYTHGTRMVQKLIETLKPRQQLLFVISALEHLFYALIKELNDDRVVQRCLQCSEDSTFIIIYDRDMEEQVVAYVSMASELGWLASNWFTMPKAKRKTERVGIGYLMAASALMETHEFGKEMEHVVDYLANFGKGKDNSTYCEQFATSLMVHKSYYLSLKLLFSERNGTDQPTSLYDAAKRACYGLLGRLEMAYLFFTSDILKGNSMPIFEAATYETAAVGKSTGCGGKKRIHQLRDIGWLVSIWFPKPRVKMKLGKIKHEKLVRIP